MPRIVTLPGRLVWTLALGALAACSEQPGPAPEPADVAPAADPATTVFTGARLIVGNGTVIENATFSVGPDNRFGFVGSAAEVQAQARSTPVDLAGLTVMPAIVDTHTHLSQEREALTQDLRRRAYYGLSAAMSLGQDMGELPFQMRAQTIPGAARFFTAGRGITAPEPGRSRVRPEPR